MKIKWSFILFLGVCWTFAVQAQTDDSLKGEWALSTVSIVENNEGVEIELPYLSGKYDNSISCIYPLLKFQEDNQCRFTGDDQSEVSVKYTMEDPDGLALWFSAPVKWKWLIDSEEKLHLSREYVQHDNESKRVVLLKINLIYSKL
jgi:hypothetical protein